jgi:hypothetical protein
MTTETLPVFPTERDIAAARLFEQDQRKLDKFQTRYVYLPFQDGQCAPIPGGYVPAGIIHPIPAPKGKCNVRLLEKDAQVLEVVSPSAGVTDIGAPKRTHGDPVIQALIVEIERLQREARERGQEPASIAIYLQETDLIVNSVVQRYLQEGAIEITALAGMPEAVFQRYQINQKVFGADEVPQTAHAIRERLAALTGELGKKPTEAGAVLKAVADQILRSVATCEAFCKQHIEKRHLQMDNPQDTNPKGYSRRDLRAIEFIGAIRREDYLQRREEEQREAALAIPKLLEAQERRDQMWAQMFEQMSNTMTEQTKTLQSIAGKK